MILDPTVKAIKFSTSDAIDHFDRIPESISLVIFNKVCDIKALGRCCLVSRRFQYLASLVENVFVRVDCVISKGPPSSFSETGVDDGGRTRGVFFNVARLVIGIIVKPLQALGLIIRSPSSTASPSKSTLGDLGSKVSHHSPTEALKRFKEIKKLKVELPASELRVDDGVLLKWRANFGSTLDRCVILSASSIVLDKSENCSNLNDTISMELCGVDDSGNIPVSLYVNGSLKLRIVWTIGSLVAAATRHFLLQPIIKDHGRLERLDMTDSTGQGMLSMNKLQLKETKEKHVSASVSSQRTLLPALSLKLWYASHLEIPGGIVLKGVTLVAIRPSSDISSENWDKSDEFCAEGSWVTNAFEEPYRTAAEMLVKGRTYSLQMISF